LRTREDTQKQYFRYINSLGEHRRRRRDALPSLSRRQHRVESGRGRQ